MWQRFWANFKQDLKLWLYLVTVQQLFRVYYIFALKKYVAGAGVSDYLLTLGMGLRFDSLWATVAVFVPLLLVSLPGTCISKYQHSAIARNFRWVYAIICTSIICAIYITSIEYFLEYHDIFNQFLFGLIYDDRQAIFQTIWAQDYILKYTLIIIFTLVASVWLGRRILINHKHSTVRHHPVVKFVLFCGIIVFYVGAFRGGLGPRPIQTKDAAVVPDPFLSKAVISPFTALKSAIKQRRLIGENDFGQQFILNNDLVALLDDQHKHSSKLNDFDSYLLRTASGWAQEQNIPRAKHVFVIVGESYDGWAMQPAYAHLKLTNSVQNIAHHGGISVDNFLPAADGTVAALNTIFSGLQETEIMINYQPKSLQTYPTAPAAQFKQLGYQTNFFYGGYLSWQKIGDLAAAQGFDNVYGAAHMGSWLKTTEWGVEDHEMYDFILKTLDNGTPSYNVIMTTSNHPPFRVELEKHGCDLAYISQELKAYPDSPASAMQLGHLWYADKTVGDFVHQAEQKLTLTLFAITGDHYGRRHVLPNPPIRETAIVPLVLYGKGITDQINPTSELAGSHIDIGPTLVELVAPRGFSYYALGNNLFADGTTQTAINKNFIIKHKEICLASAAETDLKQQHARQMGLSWWRVIHGNTLE